MPRSKKVTNEIDGKKYLISLHDPSSLSEIDQPKPVSLRRLVAHKSEKQWALARENPHHLLEFPQGTTLFYHLFNLNANCFVKEILDLIFEFTLIDKNHTISPDVTTTNKNLAYKMHQTYTLDGRRRTHVYYSRNSETLSTIVSEQRYDSEGKYFVLHKVYRQMIDATLLRVSKSICTQATKMLYGGNVFRFSMTEISKKGYSRMMVGDELHPKFKRLSWQNWTQNFKAIIQNAIDEVERQVPTLNLSFYVYHDHFARFLHAVGSAKAAMIKDLHFNGVIKVHLCDLCGAGRNTCEEDLIDNLKVYIPLINKFCTNLQNLVINIREDYKDSGYGSNVDLEARRLEADLKLRSILENEFRELKTVRSLKVYRLEPGRYGDYSWTPTEKMEAGEETEAWFKKRADRWLHEELEMEKSRRGVENMIISEDGGSRTTETPPCMFWLKR